MRNILRNLLRPGPLLLLVVVAAAIAGLLALRSEPAADVPGARLQAPEVDLSGFARAEGPAEIRFPEDNGPHPDYLTEWWYYTGNLDTEDGRHFGYQLTFFRRALVPPELVVGDRLSDWAADQIYLAHFALTDVAAENFYYFERYSRGAAGLAGAQADPYNVWLENWQVSRRPDGSYRMVAEQDGVILDLTLTDLKGPVLHGIDGYSRKGPEPGNASYYISQTRLAAEGTVTIDEQAHAVSGLSWMDHEYSTSALSSDQVGWDWFSIQLDDGSELMLFQLREEDGGIAEFSSGSVIAPDGTVRSLSREDFAIAVEDTWTSPHTDADYPAAWTIAVPSEEMTLEIRPYNADQELRVSFTYWEGAVQVNGTKAGQTVSGSGYVELTGYAHSMQGEF